MGTVEVGKVVVRERLLLKTEGVLEKNVVGRRRSRVVAVAMTAIAVK